MGYRERFTMSTKVLIGATKPTPRHPNYKVSAYSWILFAGKPKCKDESFKRYT